MGVARDLFILYIFIQADNSAGIILIDRNLFCPIIKGRRVEQGQYPDPEKQLSRILYFYEASSA